MIITPRNMIHNYDWPFDIFELFSHTLGRERMKMIKKWFLTWNSLRHILHKLCLFCFLYLWSVIVSGAFICVLTFRPMATQSFKSVENGHNH